MELQKQISKGLNLKKTLLIFSVFLGMILIAVAYWVYTQFYVSTEDAYVDANVVQVAARVTGAVEQVNVVENQFVKKDDVLFQLDQALFLVKIDKAEAQVKVDQANLADAEVIAQRAIELVGKGAISLQDRDNAIAKRDAAKSQLALDEAVLHQAKLDLEYTTVTAATDGYVANITLRPHDTVPANEPQFALVSSEEFWVEANFKETELERIKIGASASVELDMYPGYTFKGVVESISRGSGNAFSLLPPQNATGNWVKVTQRVPVRIRILDGDEKHPLRIGTSAKVTVDLDGFHHE